MWFNWCGFCVFSGPPRFEGDRPRFGDRDGYRGGPRGPPGEFGGEKGGAPADYQPAFNRVMCFSMNMLALVVLYDHVLLHKFWVFKLLLWPMLFDRCYF